MRLVLPLTLLHFVLRANGLSLLQPERWFERNDDAGDAIKPHRMSRSAPTLPDPTELKARWEAELKPPRGAGDGVKRSGDKPSTLTGFDASLSSGDGDSLETQIRGERVRTNDDEDGDDEDEDEETVHPDPTPIVAGVGLVASHKFDAEDSLSKYAVGDTVTACFATVEMRDFLINWLEHVRRADMRNVLVIAMDAQTVRWCDDNGVDRMDASDSIDKSAMDDGAAGVVAETGWRHSGVGFNLLGEAKTASLAKLLDAGLNVFLSDVDVVWLRDPRAYFETGQLANADVAVTSDCVFGSERDRPEEDEFGQVSEPTKASANTGVTLFRSNPRAKAFVAAWRRAQRERRTIETHKNDQQHFQDTLSRWHAFNKPAEVFKFDEVSPDAKTDNQTFPDDWRRGFRPRYYHARPEIIGDEEENAIAEQLGADMTVHVRADGVSFDAYDKLKRSLEARFPRASFMLDMPDGTGDRDYAVETKTRVALLPTNLFPNGHLHFVGHHAGKQGFADEVYAVHNTHNYGGSAGKVGRFREHGMWAVDGEEYYFGDSKAKAPKYLKVRFTVPEYLADPTPNYVVGKGERPERHLELLQWQTERVRDGLALANITGRTLILPPMLCTCDRWWYLFQNCTNGDMTLPFVCPNDHVYLAFQMRQPGKGLSYREHTFLRRRREFAGRSSDPKRLEERAIRSVARLTFCDEGAEDGNCDPTPIEGVMTTLPGYVPDPETDALIDGVTGDPAKDVAVKYGARAKHVLKALAGADDVDMLVVDGLGRGLNEGWDEGVTPFAGFDNSRANQLFHRVTQYVMETWCCYFHSEEDRGVVPHQMTPYGSGRKKKKKMEGTTNKTHHVVASK